MKEVKQISRSLKNKNPRKNQWSWIVLFLQKKKNGLCEMWVKPKQKE